MNRILLACMLVMFSASAARSQTTDQSGLLCSLAREQAPAIRGVKLGMTSDELHASVPGIREDYKTVVERAQRSPSYGEVTLSASPPETGKGERFEGIQGFYFRLFDDRLVGYSVFYRGPGSNPRGAMWPHVDDLIGRFAAAYHLPGPPNWVTDGSSKLIRCKGFDVRISTGDDTVAVITESGNTWAAEQKKRGEAYQEQLRTEFKP